MNLNEIKMRSLAFAIGLEFDEVRTILSEETLNSINMTNIKGGGTPPVDGYCGPWNTVQCGTNCACASTSVSSSVSSSPCVSY